MIVQSEASRLGLVPANPIRVYTCVSWFTIPLRPAGLKVTPVGNGGCDAPSLKAGDRTGPGAVENETLRCERARALNPWRRLRTAP